MAGNILNGKVHAARSNYSCALRQKWRQRRHTEEQISGRLRRCGRSLLAVLLVVLLDATSRVNQLLAAGEKRMACRANLKLQIPDCRAGFKCIAAHAGDNGFLVLWMDSGFHSRNFLSDKDLH